jgi:hypothetical protein
MKLVNQLSIAIIICGIEDRADEMLRKYIDTVAGKGHGNIFF